MAGMPATEPMGAPIGLLGGTFDPIHYGHLRTAFELLQKLNLSEVVFIPAGQPPHRETPLASAALRLEMVRAATSDQPGFSVDDREIGREGRSYSVDTVRELRQRHPLRPLCLLLGMDAFLGMPGWHRWLELFELCHVVVARRPGWDAPIEGALGELLARRGATALADLHRTLAGRILVQAVTQLEIASSDLRVLLLSGGDLRYLVPEPVRAIIRRTGCYAQRVR
jgi:nicotinate-nucleotide adenylyltransferase